MQIVPSNILEIIIEDETFADEDGFYSLEDGLWCELIENSLYIVTIH